MSRADEIFKENCREILTNGVWDTDLQVRPHWEDGTPAHTVKKFGIVNRYNLQEEFPILTLRRTYFKTCIDELLWIWQKKSNNIRDLNGHIWDSWADENGSIGKAYGYQLGVKHRYPEGEMDQVDRVLYDLKHNPASRRILTNIYNFADLHEMHLYPCAYSMTFNGVGTRIKRHLTKILMDVNICHDPAAERIVFQVIDHTIHLIHHAFLILMLHTQLIAVGLADGTVFIRPLIPDVAVKIVNIVGLLLPDPQHLIRCAL